MGKINKYPESQIRKPVDIPGQVMYADSFMRLQIIYEDFSEYGEGSLFGEYVLSSEDDKNTA